MKDMATDQRSTKNIGCDWDMTIIRPLDVKADWREGWGCQDIPRVTPGSYSNADGQKPNYSDQ